MIFDEKMLLLVRKVWYVAGNHRIDTLKESVYSSVVSQDSVHVGVLLVEIKDVDILEADIQNVYLEAPRKMFVLCQDLSLFHKEI